jgi:uncharacterized protein YcfJ
VISFGKIAIAALVLAGLLMSGCSGQPLSTREKGTLAGTALGAGAGAIIGSAVGAPGAGAAIGGVLAGATGFALGNEIQNQEIADRRTKAEIQHQQYEIEHQWRQIHELTAKEDTE